MNKEDILAKSREEHKDGDLVKREINISASAAGAFAALFLTTIFFVLQVLLKNEFNFGLYAIMFCFGAANFIIRAVNMKRKSDIVFSVLYSLATLVLTVVFVFQLISSTVS